jgi:hypothetical protein
MSWFFEDTGPYPNIIRTVCSVDDFPAPNGRTLELPVNAGRGSSPEWPWRYYAAIGNSLDPNGGIDESPNGGNIHLPTNLFGKGLRTAHAAFAYIATDPMQFDFNLLGVTSLDNGETATGTFNITIFHKVWNSWINAAEWETLYVYTDKSEFYFGTGYNTETYALVSSSQDTFTHYLPATRCPKVVWLSISMTNAYSVEIDCSMG